MNHTASLLLLLGTALAASPSAQRPIPAIRIGEHYCLSGRSSVSLEVRLTGGHLFLARAVPHAAAALALELVDGHGRVVGSRAADQNPHTLSVLVPLTGTYTLRVRNCGDFPTIVDIDHS
jgi:hypothetical protein